MKSNNNGISRRKLLAAIPMLATPVIAAGETTARRGKPPADVDHNRRIGLALGAGGANGLVHIDMLEVLEQMGLRPYRIAGSSIGAVVGALSASGMPAADIKALVTSAFTDDERSILDKFMSEHDTHWLELVEFEVGKGGLLDSQRLLSHFYDSIQTMNFSDLEIRLDVVAGDLWAKEQVVLNDGALLPAVQASMAIPGVFPPVSIDGRVLIDGGTVNPVPWDLLFEDCDIVIGIDVSGVRTRPPAGQSGYFEVLFNSVKVMQSAIVGEKMRNRKPDIFIAPEIRDIRALEFYEAEKVFEQAKPARTQLEEELSALLSRQHDGHG